ncbi:hydrogenase expression/formation protein [Nautilia profundicola AmH]|uniref:Hydrogenase expression/formation protein n=1 Tax=Nautilia profundicola (strain ATCC BAA-1463 / DSM 18972 / AmH) TaxID=598659 RepID=B9L8N5_NAUPA|nr:HyaD/HybD family hydrogenase maturation endopeptidase [Nautilia profundicola]ACM93709.1 hydrogenase expression/formation protein [Nautilia profundicola AmH]
MKILVLGIGNILFGDEGIGVHLANFIDEKYEFKGPHQVDIIDGGTLAQRLIPIITDYDKVFIFDCVDVDEANIGDVYFFDFRDVPECVSWQGSAHEVEMLQTLQMIEMMGDLPETKIIGVVPYVIGEDTTFSITPEVQKAAKLMEKILINEIKKLGVEPVVKNEKVTLTQVAKDSYKRGVPEESLRGMEVNN